MPIKPGDLLTNATTGEARFRVEGLLAEGRSYYIALGADTKLDEMKVVLKAVKYGSDEPTSEEIAQRRAALEVELRALATPAQLLPEPIDFFEVSSDEGASSQEAVLVLEHHEGKTLRAEVARTNKGMKPARAMALTHEIALALGDLHEAGFVFRDLNPEHVILGIDDIIHFCGTGSIAAIGERPVAAKFGTSSRYSAPEVRGEMSGKFLKPVADVYSLGAMLAFLLTGIEPTPRVESPLTPEAYERLKAMPEGYGLLVAKLMQPMAKKRFSSIKQVLPWLQGELPTSTTKGFEKLDLPAPFFVDGEEGKLPAFQNRSQQSNLSAGPLISVTREPSAPPKPSNEALAKQDKQELAPQPWYRSCLPWMSAAILVPLGLVLAIVAAV